MTRAFPHYDAITCNADRRPQGPHGAPAQRPPADHKEGRPVNRLDDLLAVTALLLLAGAAHGAVFGNAGGYIAAGGGVGLGLLVAAAGARWRWNVMETLIGSVVVYLAFGGALALPTTTAHRVLPTIATLQGRPLLFLNIISLTASKVFKTRKICSAHSI